MSVYLGGMSHTESMNDGMFPIIMNIIRQDGCCVGCGQIAIPSRNHQISPRQSTVDQEMTLSISSKITLARFSSVISLQKLKVVLTIQ